MNGGRVRDAHRPEPKWMSSTGELIDIERVTISLEGGRWKSTRLGTSLAAYPTSRTGLTGGMGRRTVRQRALCLPSGAYTRHLDADMHSPGKRNTQKIERKHLTLRTRIKRLVRKTICFSKTTQMHDIVLGLFVNRYAFGLRV